MDRDSQIKAIEKTFEDSRKTIDKHYSKPNVVPLEILPVYPDFKVCLDDKLHYSDFVNSRH
jgi:RNA polymerase II-associated factor 1